MRALILPALLVASSSFAATVTETRKVPDFTEIEVSDGVALEVKKGATSLTLEGDDAAVAQFSTEVVDGRLRLHRRSKDWLRSKQRLVVRVSTPSLTRLDASGGVDARLESVTGKSFKAELSGGVELDAKAIDVDALELEGSGGVNARLVGRAKTAKLNLSGGVSLKGQQLELGQVTVDASGGCDVELTAKDSITGDASGGVGLTVWGHPAKARVSTSGGAGVEYR